MRGKCDTSIILTALGVDLEGRKEVLALRVCAEESKEGWLSLLQDMRTRGATQVDLIVTGGHDGLLAAVAELFSATPRQRCLVHKQRNILCWLLVTSDYQMMSLRTPNRVSCSLPIPKRKCTMLKHSLAHFHKGVTYTVHGILTFIKRLTGFCLQSLHHRFVAWTKPGTPSLMLEVLTDLA
jgi:hypothetical protein